MGAGRALIEGASYGLPVMSIDAVEGAVAGLPLFKVGTATFLVLISNRCRLILPLELIIRLTTP